MTETLPSVSSMPKEAKKTRRVSRSETERAAVRELVKAARARGEDLTGPDGLLKVLTKDVLEIALEEEMTEHLGYDKHAAEGRNNANSRNGTRAKTVTTPAAGEVVIEVPRDRDGTFEPVIVKKRQRRLNDVDAVVLSLFARGLTTGEISAHFAEVYGVSISKDTISRITDRVVEEMQAWASRPLQAVYAAIFIDAIFGLGPRWPGRQPAVLCRDRGRPKRPPGRVGVVGRHPRLRREREVLAGGVDRAEEPRRAGCLLPGL